MAVDLIDGPESEQKKEVCCNRERSLLQQRKKFAATEKEVCCNRERNLLTACVYTRLSEKVLNHPPRGFICSKARENIFFHQGFSRLSPDSNWIFFVSLLIDVGVKHGEWNVMGLFTLLPLQHSIKVCGLVFLPTHTSEANTAIFCLMV